MDRHSIRSAAIVVTVVLVAGLAVAAVASSGSAVAADATRAPGGPATTADVVRRTIQSTDVLDGTLGYTGAYEVRNLQATAASKGIGSGMVTSVADVGAIVEPGGVVYTLDNALPVTLLRGEMPAWRRLATDMPDGPDVAQLERNLQELGFGFETVAPDEHWDDATTEAVQTFQASLGLDDDGVLEFGEIVFLPGPIRVTEVLSDVGSIVRVDSRVLGATSTEREVTVNLEADRQGIATIGAAVAVELPDGTETPGRITEIGTVASVPGGASADPDPTPTVPVTIRLDDPGAIGSLDGAPVKIRIVRESREAVLAVPVGALLALAEGGYAVEVVDDLAQTHLVGVDIGLFEDGFVEVSSDQLSEGDRVVVPS